jgi:DNA-binding NtrC family response regulator
MANLLIVDDELSMRQFLTHLFQREGHSIRVAENGRRALEMLRQQPVDVIISDVRMPDIGGIDLLRATKELHPQTEVIMMTAFANEETAREAVKLGAFNFIYKPFDNDLLKVIVQRAVQKIADEREKEALQVENEALIKGQRARGQLGNIIGRSDRMQSVYQMIETVAVVQSTVLITGESGTGKELVARAIHDLSPRAQKPFVSVNCGAFTETLLESELFGYVKGSFTGATANRKGLFEAADQGTIFLDEIGEMSPALQAKILRVTQDGRFQRIGSNTEIHTNARILAASNRNLEDEVKKGRFRDDLYYRLNVVELNIPPLRERREDIIPLATQFIAEFTQGKARFAPSVTECLERYSWPGNVRELRNAMERAALLSRGELILDEHLPNRVRETASESRRSTLDRPEAERLEEIENQAILQALAKHNYNRTEAARSLGISRRALLYKLQRLRDLGHTVDPR